MESFCKCSALSQSLSQNGQPYAGFPPLSKKRHYSRQRGEFNYFIDFNLTIFTCSLPFVSSRLSPDVRILSSLFVILVVFIVTTVMVKVDVSGCISQFFTGTMASVALVSGASNLFSGSMFGISGHFPMRISQALISGRPNALTTIYIKTI